MISARSLRSRMKRKFQARLCVQQRLACSAGDKPARVKARSPVARMAERREIKDLKPIGEAIERVVSESPGRNESKRIGGPENEKNQRPNPQP
jgi:hypothetical protein